jgi:hypothetical protein
MERRFLALPPLGRNQSSEIRRHSSEHSRTSLRHEPTVVHHEHFVEPIQQVQPMDRRDEARIA